MLTAALGLVSAMASRRAMAKLWPILTGEPPPVEQTPSEPAPAPRDQVSARES